jgi:hypothetical protein
MRLPLFAAGSFAVCLPTASAAKLFAARKFLEKNGDGNPYRSQRGKPSHSCVELLEMMQWTAPATGIAMCQSAVAE